MEDNNKKETNEQQEETKEKKQENAKEKKKEKKQESGELPEGLKNLFDEHLQDEELKRRVKVVRIGKPVLSKKEMIIKTVLAYLVDFILIISISGYIPWVDATATELVLFSVVFTTIETFLKYVIVRYFPKILMYSMGTIFLAITIVTFAAVSLAFQLNILSQMSLIWFLVLFMIIRSILSNLLITHVLLQNRKK